MSECVGGGWGGGGKHVLEPEHTRQCTNVPSGYCHRQQHVLPWESKQGGE
jgi:hypothetical protein